MKSILTYLSTVVTVMFVCDAFAAEAPKRKALSPAQQKTFLSKRTSGNIMGTFDSYCSRLYAINDVAIHTEDGVINGTRLSSPFPDFYKPTWEELFDAIAQQTKSSWKYDPTRDYWVFGAPQQPRRFDVVMAEGWKAHDEGLYVGYQPPIAPVGMDVYVLGRYSAARKNDEAKLPARVREAIGVQFAKRFKKDVRSER